MITASEINGLLAIGIKIEEIAEIEEVTPNAIYNRLWRKNNPTAYKTCQKRYRERHLEVVRLRMREQRRGHPEWAKNAKKRRRQVRPESVREERRQIKIKRHDESLLTAFHHKQPWDSDDIEYLEIYGREKTIMELTIDLGRTYQAVQKKAWKSGISLYSPQKCLAGK